MNVNGEHINTDEDKLAEDMDKLALYIDIINSIVYNLRRR